MSKLDPSHGYLKLLKENKHCILISFIVRLCEPRDIASSSCPWGVRPRQLLSLWAGSFGPPLHFLPYKNKSPSPDSSSSGYNCCYLQVLCSVHLYELGTKQCVNSVKASAFVSGPLRGLLEGYRVWECGSFPPHSTWLYLQSSQNDDTSFPSKKTKKKINLTFRNKGLQNDFNIVLKTALEPAV